MLENKLPDLTFPDLSYGKHEIPRDLKRLIFRGGAATSTRTVRIAIENGELGHPINKRIPLVKKIHESIANRIARSLSRPTIIGTIEKIVYFYRWADKNEQDPTIENLEQLYKLWTDSLLQRTRFKKDLSENAARGYVVAVGSVFDDAIGRTSPISKHSPFRKRRRRKVQVTQKQEKQSLEEVFSLGHMLLDISDALTVEAVTAPLPTRISIRNGAMLELWSRLKSPEKFKNPARTPQIIYVSRLRSERRADWAADGTARTRYPILNLRMQVEMFMLMGQSAINLAQVHRLRMDQWRYKPSTQGYEIRTYKHRRWGPVIFEIYPQYRGIFERYIQWRNAIFPDDPDGLLFPILGIGGKKPTRHPERPPAFDLLQRMCTRAGIRYLPPSALRKSNVNWMLRHTQDPDLTAEEKQHTTKVLLEAYETPSQHRAVAQIKAFWAKFDPTRESPGGGVCAGESAEPIDATNTGTQPDCATPSGCHFCANMREVDTFDHVWSLASFRFTKTLELRASSKILTPKEPVENTIERISEKLKYIQNSSTEREQWVTEALTRIEEGRLHPKWDYIIQGT